MRTVLFGMPRSGTTYGFSLLSEALRAQGPLREVFEPNRLEDGQFHRLDGMVWPDEDPALVKILYGSSETHGWTVDAASTAFEHFDRKVFLVRDPRDRWISDFFYSWFSAHRPNAQDFDRAFEMVRKKERFPSKMPFFSLFTNSRDELEAHAVKQQLQINELSNNISFLRSNNWQIIRYEDLVDQKWRELEEYLGLSLKRTKKIEEKYRHVARSMSHGDWRRWFTDEDVRVYLPVYNRFLSENGYDENDWKLDYPSYLSPKMGSMYMLGLYSHEKRTKGSSNLLNWLLNVIKKHLFARLSFNKK